MLVFRGVIVELGLEIVLEIGQVLKDSPPGIALQSQQKCMEKAALFTPWLAF